MATQQDLFAARASLASPSLTVVCQAERFDGETYEPAKDSARLSTQLECVLWLLRDSRWWTLPDLTASVARLMSKKVSDSSVTARIRDLRKERFGSHEIDKRRRNTGGTWEYRLVPKKERP